jgi:hypothetical protein
MHWCVEGGIVPVVPFTIPAPNDDDVAFILGCAPAAGQKRFAISSWEGKNY